MTGMHVYAALPAAPISIPYASKVIAGVAGAESKATQQIAAIFTRMTANPAVRSGMRALKVPHVDLASGDSIWSPSWRWQERTRRPHLPAARHPSPGTPQTASRRIWRSRRTRRAWVAISAGPSNQGMGASLRVVAFQLLAISCLQAPAIAAIVKRGRIALTQPQQRPCMPRRGSQQEDKVTPGTLGSLGKISRLHPNRPAIGLQTCAAPSWARRALRGRAGRRRP